MTLHRPRKSKIFFQPTKLPALLFAIGLTVAPHSYAATLFENLWAGFPGSANCAFECFASPDLIGAENFTLAADSVVEEVTFDVWYEKPKDISSLSVDWAIWNNSGTLPTGAPISSGTVIPTSANLGVMDVTYDHYQFTLDIPDQGLVAGDYWVSFDVNLASDSFALYWDHTSDGDGIRASSTDGGASWFNGYPSAGGGNSTFSVLGYVGSLVNQYSVGGTVSGLTGSVTLQNNGGDDEVLSADGGFTFATELDEGLDYAVTVSSQPAGQTCSVTNGSGTDITADVSDVEVDCVDDPVVQPEPEVIPTLPIYGLVLSVLGLLFVAVRRLRLSAK